jgi:hypothetical protein
VPSEVVRAIRLSNLLCHLAVDPGAASEQVILELAGGLVRTVTALHQSPGQPRHGAIAPRNVAVAETGSMLLLELALVKRIELLGCNREQLWRHFGLAMPPSASLPRFDRRTDVTQMAAVVLALLLRRPLAADECPRDIATLVVTATAGWGDASLASAVRIWLQQAMQLHARANFASAIDAERAWPHTPAQNGTRLALQQLRGLVQRVAASRSGVPGAQPQPDSGFPKLHAS